MTASVTRYGNGYIAHPRARPGMTPSRTGPVGMAVIGAGYWGPNIVRNALAFGGTDLKWVCDRELGRAHRILVGRQPQDGLPQLRRERVERGRHDVRIDLREDRAPAGRHRGRSVPSISRPTGRWSRQERAGRPPVPLAAPTGPG